MRAAPPIRPPAERVVPERRRAPSRPARRPAPPTGAIPSPVARPPVPGLRPPVVVAPVSTPAGEAGIDPRISARRQAVRQEEDRRRLRRFLWLAGVVGVAVALAASTRTPLLDVDRVAVEGTERLTSAEVDAVLATAGLDRGDPLLEVDLASAREALEALPSVTDATLERRWPGTIVVQIVERAPVAAVAVAGGTALVGADGVVVAVTDPADVAAGAGTVAVAGPPDLAPGDRYDAPEVLAVAAAVPEQLRPFVASVGAGEGEGAVEIHLTGGGVVRLGAADQLATKLVAATTVLTQVDNACLASVDVRVPSAPAVTRVPGC